MNISRVSLSTFGYKGKYLNAEEELLKIRPGVKLREVVEMMKTHGLNLTTLTDTPLSQEGMGEVGMDYSARRKAGVYYIWDPTKIRVEDIKEMYASRVAKA
eukprot:1439726-Pleurochrysis_carterae.AAC.2